MVLPINVVHQCELPETPLPETFGPFTYLAHCSCGRIWKVRVRAGFPDRKRPISELHARLWRLRWT